MRRHILIKSLLALAPSLRHQSIRYNGTCSLIGDISDACVRNYFLTARFEPEFFEIAAPFLAKGGVFFDVGANFGFCTFGLIEWVVNEKLACHMFEANEQICAFLDESRRLHPDKDVTINCAVVTNTPGVSKFEVNAKALGESCVSPQGTAVVVNLMLDQYIEARGIDRVDFMKIDVEGSEPNALKGANKALQSGVVKAIYVEVVPSLLAKQGFSVNDILGG
jgi:FkbM family methyltransferase